MRFELVSSEVFGVFSSSQSCLSPFLNLSSGYANRDVLLVFPGKLGAPNPKIPLSLLYLASSLQQDGFNVRILDMRIQDYRKTPIGNPLFVGISCMGGQQINPALQFANYVRLQNPCCLLVWGGVHPTLLPEQTVTSDLVDIVVRGEAEYVIRELATVLSENLPLDSVPAITYSINDTIKSTPEGNTVNLDDLPYALPYNLLDLEAYPSFRAGQFQIQTSRGCPHRCGFCYSSVFYKNRWRAKNAQHVLDEIEYLLKQYQHLKTFDSIDDDVFVDEYRLEQICKGILKRHLKIQWRANCRFDDLCSYDREFFELLDHSGCVSLNFTGESGSERIQELYCRDVSGAEMLESVDKLRRWAPRIKPYVSWLIGLPGETDEDWDATFTLMDQLCEINPKTRHYGVFVYTPFSGSTLRFLPPEFAPPQTLEEWGTLSGFNFSPWHSKEQTRKLHTIQTVTQLVFYPQTMLNHFDLTYRVFYKLMSKIAKYRWRHRNFSFPVEQKLADAVAKNFESPIYAL